MKKISQEFLSEDMPTKEELLSEEMPTKEELLSEEMPTNEEMPTKMEMFVAELQKTGTSAYKGSVHSVTVRIPSFDFCTIEALSRAGGMARNKVIVNLLESAIQEMWGELSPEMHEIVSGLQAPILRDLLSNDTVEQGEL